MHPNKSSSSISNMPSSLPCILMWTCASACTSSAGPRTRTNIDTHVRSSHLPGAFVGHGLSSQSRYCSRARKRVARCNRNGALSAKRDPSWQTKFKYTLGGFQYRQSRSHTKDESGVDVDIDGDAKSADGISLSDDATLVHQKNARNATATATATTKTVNHHRESQNGSHEEPTVEIDSNNATATATAANVTGATATAANVTGATRANSTTLATMRTTTNSIRDTTGRHANTDAPKGKPTKGLASPRTLPSKPKSKPKSTNAIIRANKNRILTLGRQQDDIVTVADLEKLLFANGYVRRTDLLPTATNFMSSNKSSAPSLSSTTDNSNHSKNSNKSKTSSSRQIAFPQRRVVDYKSVTLGSSVTGGIAGIVLGLTIYPNLWLVGMALGGAYGYDTAVKERLSNEQNDTHNDPSIPPSSNIISNLLVQGGKILAKIYLRAYDAFNGIWFMYKTGQLSYEYYKQYETLDQKFQIQTKVDAWNSRFQQGKIKFDQWEQENEIGRRALATVRTIWLVEETSLKKQQRRRRQSRYRVVQYYYRALFFVRRGTLVLWNTMTTKGGAAAARTFLENNLTELREGLRKINIRTDSSNVGKRIGATVVTLLLVYSIGAMFAVAPTVLSLLAVVVGVVFPTWVPESLERFTELLSDMRVRGPDENYNGNVNKNRNVPSSSSKQYKNTAAVAKKKTKLDKNRYHYYYQTADGRKQWYRTGQPWFSFGAKQEPEKKGFFGFGRNTNDSERPTSSAANANLNTWNFWPPFFN